MARSYSVYEAKAKLSELLRNVKRGNEVVVLERGQPIARVVPFVEEDTLKKRLHALTQSGLVMDRTEKRFPETGYPVSGGLKQFLDDR